MEKVELPQEEQFHTFSTLFPYFKVIVRPPASWSARQPAGLEGRPAGWWPEDSFRVWKKCRKSVKKTTTLRKKQGFLYGKSYATHPGENTRILCKTFTTLGKTQGFFTTKVAQLMKTLEFYVVEATPPLRKHQDSVW